jgi:hypothetical protein
MKVLLDMQLNFLVLSAGAIANLQSYQTLSMIR